MNKETVTVHFTEELLEEWTKEYFKTHPRAKKNPIKYASHESLNTWHTMHRINKNNLKQNMKEFTMFVSDKNNTSQLGISKCRCKVIIYKASKTRCDPDNYSPKMVMDGLTADASGTIVDDGDSCIKSLTIEIEYRKGKHEMDIIFYDCEYDLKLLEETRIKERVKKEKSEATKLKNKLKKKK